MSSEPYNPLDKHNLAHSIERALLSRSFVPLAEAKGIKGAGVYAIYYAGDFQAYDGIRAGAPPATTAAPIYVGKAIPEGGRIGGLGNDAAIGNSLSSRLGDHRRSVSQAVNLDVGDFWARYLLVDAIWIPLGENILIESYRPVWNGAIYGFGNNAPGRGRLGQIKSPWDVLHPGRRAFARLPDGDLTQSFLMKRASDHIAGLPVEPLPPSASAMIHESAAAAEAAANEAGTDA